MRVSAYIDKNYKWLYPSFRVLCVRQQRHICFITIHRGSRYGQSAILRAQKVNSHSLLFDSLREDITNWIPCFKTFSFWWCTLWWFWVQQDMETEHPWDFRNRDLGSGIEWVLQATSLQQLLTHTKLLCVHAHTRFKSIKSGREKKNQSEKWTQCYIFSSSHSWHLLNNLECVSPVSLDMHPLVRADFKGVFIQ